MCRFQSEHAVLICPVASDQVCTHLHEVFGEQVQCSKSSDQGTLIEVPSSIDPTRFQVVTREAIAAAQVLSPDPGAR